MRSTKSITKSSVYSLALREIPQHGDSVLAAAGTQGAIGRNDHGIHVAGVSHQVSADLAVDQVPHLNNLVPASGHNDRVGRDRGEAHAAHPLSVRIHVLDGVFAVFHNLMVLLREPDTICLLSTENATLSTSLVWPMKRRVVVPMFRSHRRSVPPHDPDSASWPSDESITKSSVYSQNTNQGMKRGFICRVAFSRYSPAGRLVVHQDRNSLLRDLEREVLLNAPGSEKTQGCRCRIRAKWRCGGETALALWNCFFDSTNLPAPHAEVHER